MKIMKKANIPSHFEYWWNNPPAPFNPLVTEEVLAERKRKARLEKRIKAELDEYHKTLKHLPNDEYYDKMDAKEEQLRKQYQ